MIYTKPEWRRYQFSRTVSFCGDDHLSSLSHTTAGGLESDFDSQAVSVGHDGAMADDCSCCCFLGEHYNTDSDSGCGSAVRRW